MPSTTPNAGAGGKGEGGEQRQGVIELSVAETNRLRAKLGLAPLRIDDDDDGKEKEQVLLELNVDDSNALRAKLGLPPLRTTTTTTTTTDGDGSSRRSRHQERHAPAPNLGHAAAAEARAERERLQRQVEQGAAAQYVKTSLGDDIDDDNENNNDNDGENNHENEQRQSSSASSFAAQMRRRKKAAKRQAKKQSKAAATTTTRQNYDESDVRGLVVGHAVTDFQQGSTTVLTLADAEILATADDDDDNNKGSASSQTATTTGNMVINDDEAQLQNVHLAERDRLQTGLREKRRLEMGAGRAGGYAGFDDDEFQELGGTTGPSRAARGAGLGPGGGSKQRASPQRRRGFQIGAMLDEQDQEAESDLFAAHESPGRAVSLQPSQADRTMSDFMTAEEANAEAAAAMASKKIKKEKKKSKEFKKKKKHKKDKKEHKRKVESDDDDDDDEETTPIIVHSSKQKKSLADELEETAAPVPVTKNNNRKRRRQDDDDGDSDNDGNGPPAEVTTAKSEMMDKRTRYNAAMEKGNERTKAAFAKPTTTTMDDDDDDDDEPDDDAFLNAALAKARRLNRLKQLSQKNAPVRGADAVAQHLQQSSQLAMVAPESATSSGSSGGIQFSIDDTREFTLALRVKKEQERQKSKKDGAAGGVTITAAKIKKEAPEEAVAVKGDPADSAKPEPMTVDEEQQAEEEDVDMKELAKQVKEDEPDTTDILNGGGTATVGRGLGGVLQMLRQTGEISRNKTGREEQRGRAKDERTYDDYEALDLSKVVRIDERKATSKDREFASREIKLEYRDEHGRLLTRKEAFRDMSKQFHGFGSGKRKEEKKMKQIAREQAEQRVASKQGTSEGGMLGALKATQKATGKAFVVHKT